MAGETNQSPGKYMKGACFRLALYLYDRTDLTLYGLFDESGEMHHAFVVDPPSGIGYDARGRTSQSTVTAFKGRLSQGQFVRPTTREIVADYADRAPDDASDGEIRRFIMRGRFPTLQRKKVRTLPSAPAAA